MTTNEQQPEPTDTAPAWIVSVVFWLVLFVAVSLYAAVSLAPKFERYLVLKRNHAAGRWHLVDLQKRVQQLNRVALALEDDPQFAAELARSRFGAVNPGADTITLSDELQLNFTKPTASVEVELPWYYGVVRQFAASSLLRWASLIFASVLVLFSFGFLHARYAAIVQAGIAKLTRVLKLVGQRYQADANDHA